MLGEASTTEIAQRKNAQGFEKNRDAAKAGGNVAGNARKELEAKSGKPVVSRTNYLSLGSDDTKQDSVEPAIVNSKAKALVSLATKRARGK